MRRRRTERAVQCCERPLGTEVPKMRIAMLLPLADQPGTRAYALWTTAARELSEAMAQRGMEVTVVEVPDGGPGLPSFRDGTRGVDTNLRIARLFQRANDFDIVHDLVGFAANVYASFVATPVLSTVWLDMWSCAGEAYQALNQRVYYHSPGEGDRSTSLHYAGTIPWMPRAHEPHVPNAGDTLVFAADMIPGSGVCEALDIAQRAGRSIVLIGTSSNPAFFTEAVAPQIDGTRVRHLVDPRCKEADEAIELAAGLIHAGHFDGMQQLVVIDALSRGTPVIHVGGEDGPSWMRDGQTGFSAKTVDAAVAAVGRLAGVSRHGCRAALESVGTFDAFVSRVVALYERICTQARREDRRPWGYYEVLSDEPNHKVKRLVVFPGKRLSLQRHKLRAEHWFLVDGEAAVVVDEEEIRLLSGQSVKIPKGCWHRIRNPGAQNLSVIEVQTGEYFGEDDIERKEDDFGRV